MFAFMSTLFDRIDEIARTSETSSVGRWLDRASFVFLILMIASAPHSIAATQTSWVIGMVCSLARLFIVPRPTFRIGPLEISLTAFFLWSIVSSIFSYEPAISIDKLRGAALFLIVFFVLLNIRTRQAARFAALTMIVSCMVNVIMTPAERLIGRGVRFHGVVADGTLAKSGLIEGDSILKIDGERVRSPDQILAKLLAASSSKIIGFRKDFEITVDIKRDDLRDGSSIEERLGFSSWDRNRSWRSAGFYGHYTTYAEVLQLIASLTFGLLVAGFFGSGKELIQRRSRFVFIALSVAVLLMAAALLLTVTRASQLAFIISSIVILAFGASRKWLIAAFVIGVPAAAIGLFVLQSTREVGFFDRNDLSIQYREMMWRDGVRLWTENERHFFLGVGMDSVQKRWQAWDMFDKGHQPMGHFHSMPVQLLAERGLPALLLWIFVLGFYCRELITGRKLIPKHDWLDRGIIIGCLGGTVGFFASGIVHYNLGDQEVAMVFFLLVGISVSIVYSIVDDVPRAAVDAYD